MRLQPMHGLRGYVGIGACLLVALACNDTAVPVVPPCAGGQAAIPRQKDGLPAKPSLMTLVG